jgi:hypothetical protein
MVDQAVDALGKAGGIADQRGDVAELDARLGKVGDGADQRHKVEVGPRRESDHRRDRPPPKAQCFLSAQMFRYDI